MSSFWESLLQMFLICVLAVAGFVIVALIADFIRRYRR